MRWLGKFWWVNRQKKKKCFPPFSFAEYWLNERWNVGCSQTNLPVQCANSSELQQAGLGPQTWFHYSSERLDKGEDEWYLKLVFPYPGANRQIRYYPFFIPFPNQIISETWSWLHRKLKSPVSQNHSCGLLLQPLPIRFIYLDLDFSLDSHGRGGWEPELGSLWRPWRIGPKCIGSSLCRVQ